MKRSMLDDGSKTRPRQGHITIAQILRGQLHDVEHPGIQLISISLFAIMGCLVRIFIDQLFTTGTTDVFTVASESFIGSLYANLLGCIVLGLLIGSVFSARTHPYIYGGACTGFCGSLTTFSAWVLSLSQLLTDEEGWVKGGGNHYTESMTLILTLPALFVAFFLLGDDIGKAIEYNFEKKAGSTTIVTADTSSVTSAIAEATKKAIVEEVVLSEIEAVDLAFAVSFTGEQEPLEQKRRTTPPPPPPPPPPPSELQSHHHKRMRNSARGVVALMLSSYVIFVTLLVVDGAENRHPQRRGWYLAAMVAPVGAVCRFALAKRLNVAGSFPIGTFLANWTGSIALTVAYYACTADWCSAAQDGGDPSDWRYTLLYAFSTGFCSSYTTMSTLTSEIVALRTTNGPMRTTSTTTIWHRINSTKPFRGINLSYLYAITTVAMSVLVCCLLIKVIPG